MARISTSRVLSLSFAKKKRKLSENCCATLAA
jgi:hypothetical protein